MKQVNIFLGGGVLLLEGNEKYLGYRPTVIDPILSKLNSRRNAKRFYIVKTYADLINEYAVEGQQEHYNRYVSQKADIAIFIFDGKIGDKTKEEVENACNSFDKNKHPTIFFYGINLKDDDVIVEYLNSKKQYFRHFSNKVELQQLIIEQLELWQRPKRTLLHLGIGTKFIITYAKKIDKLFRCFSINNTIKLALRYFISSLYLPKLKNYRIFLPLILCILAVYSIFHLSQKALSLEMKLGYAEIGVNIDGYRLAKTYSGKYGIITASEPYDLCADTVYSEHTEMRDSMIWLKQIKDNTWVLFNSGSVLTCYNYKKYINNSKGKSDSTYILLFSKEKQLAVPFSDYRKSLIDRAGSKGTQNQDYKRNRKVSYKIQDTLENIEKINFRDTLYLDSLNIHFGFINAKGQVIIPPVIDRIGEINDSCAVGRYKGLWGIISFRNKFFPKFEYKNQFRFNGQNHVRVEKKGKWGIIGLNGEPIIKIENDSVGINFSSGLVCVKNKGLCGFKNRNDKYVIRPMYAQAGPFSFGYAPVKDIATGKWLYIDTKNGTLPIVQGNSIVNSPLYDYADNIHYIWTNRNDTISLAEVWQGNKKGFIRLNKNKAYEFIPCQYEIIRPYFGDETMGVFIYTKNKKEGIVYYSEEITKAKYEYIRHWHGTMFVVQIDKKYGIFDIKNKSEIIPCVYDFIRNGHSFSLVELKRNDKWGIYDIYKKKWLGRGLVYLDTFVYYDDKVIKARVKEQNGNWKDL
ncbi:MAG: WG repeat-containing protein [Prevotella sp.]|nr:WG repeat-containing protein [Prevotella sp.]